MKFACDLNKSHQTTTLDRSTFEIQSFNICGVHQTTKTANDILSVLIYCQKGSPISVFYYMGPRRAVVSPWILSLWRVSISVYMYMLNDLIFIMFTDLLGTAYHNSALISNRAHYCMLLLSSKRKIAYLLFRDKWNNGIFCMCFHSYTK